MRTIEQTFQQLTALISDQTRDLALAMAELRSVAQQRDKALTERDAARAGYAAMNTRIYGPGGECFELDKARAERDKLNSYLTGCNQHGKWAGMECIGCMDAERDQLQSDQKEFQSAINKLTAERDNLSEALERNCVQYVEKQKVLIAERDAARQLMRAAEADAAETESVNSDLRTVNKRLVADLAAAVQRADNAEAILSWEIQRP